ncbi:hypothetical protein B0H19DRAFT_1079808 [Mycena capillaripes]|nr:hypothetical protein B0H19DRAFT_1079808 [Mycena capillaripes]
MHALQAGQLNVKRLISTTWDGGEIAAGMLGCSQTWLNQMIEVIFLRVSMDTTRDVQKYFGISHTVHYICASNHSIKIPSEDVKLENGIHQGDIFLAQSYIRDESYQPSLSDFCSRDNCSMLPRSQLPSEKYLGTGSSLNCIIPGHNILAVTYRALSYSWADDEEFASISLQASGSCLPVQPLLLDLISRLRTTATATFFLKCRSLACPYLLQIWSALSYWATFRKELIRVRRPLVFSFRGSDEPPGSTHDYLHALSFGDTAADQAEVGNNLVDGVMGLFGLAADDG